MFEAMKIVVHKLSSNTFSYIKTMESCVDLHLNDKVTMILGFQKQEPLIDFSYS